MIIYLYNTLTGKKEKFKPIKKGNVGIYNCGPTVWDMAHIGNFRTFIMDDIIRRVFEYFKYNVNQVMNITDIDDKTIKKSREENKNLFGRFEKPAYSFAKKITKRQSAYKRNDRNNFYPSKQGYGVQSKRWNIF